MKPVNYLPGFLQDHDCHPGHSASGCHLQYVVNAAPMGSSSNGYGCEANGGHCIPGEQCEKRRERFPVSIMSQ